MALKCRRRFHSFKQRNSLKSGTIVALEAWAPFLAGERWRVSFDLEVRTKSWDRTHS